jgi:hypothetical protein
VNQTVADGALRRGAERALEDANRGDTAHRHAVVSALFSGFFCRFFDLLTDFPDIFANTFDGMASSGENGKQQKAERQKQALQRILHGLYSCGVGNRVQQLRWSAPSYRNDRAVG